METVNNYSNIDFIFMMEDPETPIYLDAQATEKINEVEDYNYKIIRIIDVQGDDHNMALIEFNDVLVGWVPLKSSLPLFNKKLEQVEVDPEKFSNIELNNLEDDNKDFTLSFKSYQTTSRFFLYYEDELFEAIYRKNKFIAFAQSSAIDHIIKDVNQQARIKRAKFKFFATSKFDEEITSKHLDLQEEVTVSSVLPSLRIAKIRQEDVTGWISLDDLTEFYYPQHHKILTYEEAFQSHIENKTVNEELVAKSLIIKLLNENVALEKKLLKQKQRTTKVEERLDNLKSSKLGRLQIAVWERRAKRGKLL